MYVLLRNARNNKGFSLLELMLVLAIISLILSIAIPVYLGLRDKTRMEIFIADGRSAIPEIYSWLQSATSPNQNAKEIDTNCDGMIDSEDMTNRELREAGVAKTFADCRNKVFKDKSPWSGQLPLWTIDPAMPPGQMTLIEETDRIKIIGKSIGGGTVFQDYVRKS